MTGDTMDPFSKLVERVRALTGLNARQASAVAAEFPDDAIPGPSEIVDTARDLGYDIDTTAGVTTKTELAAEVSMDPATVLAEVYENCPRVLTSAFPTIGRAPAEIDALPGIREQLDALPDEIRTLLVKVDLADERMTVWLRDDANDVDRPIGPIDVSRYRSADQLHQAIRVLWRRLPRVLRADFN